MINNIINAISIHKGGGLTYLYLLHNYLDKSNKLIFLDFRVKKNIKKFKKAKVIFLKKGPFRNIRILYFRINYIKKFNIYNSNKIDKKIFKEFYLNGLPPLFRFAERNNNIYIFCQNRLLFENISIRKSFNIDYLKTEFYLLIHKSIFNLFKRDNDKLIVQTNSMKKLITDLKIKNKIVLQNKIWGRFNNDNYMNVYSLKINNKKEIKKNKFIKKLYKTNIIYFYPAFFYPHKNHSNLLEAFKILDEHNQIPYKLLLTANNNKSNNTDEMNNSNIIFLNNTSFQDIFSVYKYVDYLVYPSLVESFGLPLIEAQINNVNIIASDLPYVYDVCKPYLVFDPRSVNDILSKLKLSLKINKRLIL